MDAVALGERFNVHWDRRPAALHLGQRRDLGRDNVVVVLRGRDGDLGVDVLFANDQADEVAVAVRPRQKRKVEVAGDDNLSPLGALLGDKAVAKDGDDVPPTRGQVGGHGWGSLGRPTLVERRQQHRGMTRLLVARVPVGHGGRARRGGERTRRAHAAEERGRGRHRGEPCGDLRGRRVAVGRRCCCRRRRRGPSSRTRLTAAMRPGIAWWAIHPEWRVCCCCCCCCGCCGCRCGCCCRCGGCCCCCYFCCSASQWLTWLRDTGDTIQTTGRAKETNVRRRAYYNGTRRAHGRRLLGWTSPWASRQGRKRQLDYRRRV